METFMIVVGLALVGVLAYVWSQAPKWNDDIDD